MMPAISVIVPVYQAEMYIHRCVDSILNQTFSDFELILVDDGCSDNCGIICDGYAQKDSRVRVIHQENQGQAAARNRAVTEAEAPWLSFVDSDDLIHPQMLEHLYRAATMHNVKISMCGAVEGEKLPDDFQNPCDIQALRKKMDEAGLRLLIQQKTHRYWVVWGKLIRKEIVEKIPFSPGRIYEDNAIVCRWLYEAGTVTDLQNNYYFYQVNPEGTTKTDLSPKALDNLWALREQLRFYKEVGYSEIYAMILDTHFMMAVSYHRQFKAGNFDREISAGLRREMRSVYQKNWKRLKVDKDRHLLICSVIYPNAYHLYELEKGMERRWQSEGMIGVIKRVFRRK